MKKVERIAIATIGMFMIATGVAFIAKTRIGSDCFTLVMQACYKNFGLTLGSWSAIFGILFTSIALLCDRKKIGYSTFCYVIACKFIIDSLTSILPDPNSYIVDVLYCVLGIIISSSGSALGISARLGMSYYDAFCYAVSERLKIKYVVFRYILEGIFIVCSLLLHTYPGVGTIICFFALGPCLSFILSKIKEPIRLHLGLKPEY